MKKKVIEIKLLSYDELKKALEEQMMITDRLIYENGQLKDQLKKRCSSERPNRKTFCQLPEGHDGSHQAVIYWETEIVRTEKT